MAAAQDCRATVGRAPRDAWNAAATERIASLESRKKGCPRSAFLGLCEAGLVEGIPAGEYIGSKKNKQYAVDAVRLLVEDASLINDLPTLWKRLTPKQHNQQMNVVAALWNEGFIVHSAGRWSPSRP